MTNHPKPKRPRKVSRKIGEKTGREIMETVTGKRAMRRLDDILTKAEKRNPSSTEPI